MSIYESYTDNPSPIETEIFSCCKVFLKEKIEKKYTINNVNKEKTTIEFKLKNGVIRYLVSSYNVSVDGNKIYIGVEDGIVSFFINEDEEFKCLFATKLFIDGKRIDRRIEPILSFTTDDNKDSVYILINKISEDVGVHSRGVHGNDVIKSYGDISIVSFNLKTLEFLLIYNTEDEVEGYFSTIVSDSNGSPGVMFFNPNNDLVKSKKKLPKKFNELPEFVNNTNGDIEYSAMVTNKKMLPFVSIIDPLNGEIHKLGLDANDRWNISKLIYGQSFSNVGNSFEIVYEDDSNEELNETPGH